MAIVKVQAATGNGASLTLSIASGNCLTAQDTYFRTTSTGLAEALPTDTNGTFEVGRADTPQVTLGDDIGASGFFEKNCAAGTHTVTFETNTGHNASLTEFSGVDTGSPLVIGNSGKNSGLGTSQATGASASASLGDLALIQFGMAASVTGAADVGFTDPVANYTTLFKVTNDTTDEATLHAFRVLDASGAESAAFNWTTSAADQFWQASIFVLKTVSAAADSISPSNLISTPGQYIGWTA